MNTHVFHRTLAFFILTVAAAVAAESVSSANRLRDLDETFGARTQVKSFSGLQRLQGDYQVYAYDAVPKPLESVKVMLDGASLAAVEYAFGQTASREQIQEALRRNGTGWKVAGNALVHEIAGQMGNWEAREGHWLNHHGKWLTVYFDGRIQAQNAEDGRRQGEQRRAPHL
jgi:hypothetical protein